MKLDSFDLHVMSQKGLAQEIVDNLYGAKMSKRNAEGWVAGIRAHLRHKAELDEEQTKEEMLKSYGIEKDIHVSTRILRMSMEDMKSPRRLMALHGYDPLQWEMIYSLQKAWNVYSVADGISDMYSSTIKVKPLHGVLTSDIVREIFNEMEAPSLVKIKHAKGGKLLELPIMDLHIGKLAWANEVGEDYDLKIASMLYKDTIEEVMSRVDGKEIESILFPIGNDFFHYDNTRAETTYGTGMDTDTRWPKMLRAGFDLLVFAIQNLRAIAPVKVVYIPGNHDEMASYAAALYVDGFFRSVDDVVVDVDNLRHRKYHQYGQSLIGFAHGYKERMRIKFLMQDEADKMWGETKFRELHLAHLHSESVNEIPGMKLRRIPSITGMDRWHEQYGFSSMRTAQAFLWSKTRGLSTIEVINIVKELSGETGEIS